MDRRGWLVGAVVVLAVFAGVLIGVLRAPPKLHADHAAPVLNHRAPSFTLKNVDGKTVSLAAERRVVLLNFWATWCIPCRQEMPLISRLASEHSSQLAVLAVDTLEPAAPVEAFVKHYKLHLVPLLDSDGKVDAEYHVIAQPVTFWIDRQGVIRAIHYGAMSKSYADAKLNKLLKL